MALREFAESSDLGERAERLADTLYFGAPGWQGSWPYGIAHGINGVGIVRQGTSDFIAILTLLDPKHSEVPLEQTALLTLDGNITIRDAILAVLPRENLAQVVILPVPQIHRNTTAGTRVYGALQGTAGPGVTWAGGRTGFLTAGHVAGGNATLTDVSGRHSYGKTVHVFDPAAGGSASNVDVALIEVPVGAATTSFTKAAPIKGGSAVHLHLTKGRTASTVLGMIGWFSWPGAGLYIDLYMTNAACTVGGDSGSVVTNAGTTDAIGMVVGATGTFTSFIQVIETQLNALKAVTGLSAIQL
jgi:hypothetical protein